MTRIPDILGLAYDMEAVLPDSFEHYEAKRRAVLSILNRVENQDESGVANLMKWELGLIDLHVAVEKGVSPYGGGDYDRFAAHYGLTEESVEYARARGRETNDLILKLHYLEFAFLRSHGSGKEWIELQRELLETWRGYIDGCMGAVAKPEDFVGVNLDRALTAVGRLFECGGVVQPNEAQGWAEWIVSLATQSRNFPAREPQESEQQRHRWIADYLIHLTQLPRHALVHSTRQMALHLIAEAEAYYVSTPLNDDFVRRVAEVEAALRKHFGESGTHNAMVRKQYAALKQRAEFHQATGNGLVTAHFYREARRLVETHRQYFTEEDAAALSLAERAAIQKGIEGGEFALITAPITIPTSKMDFTAATPEATVARLYQESLASVPEWAQMEADAKSLSHETPLRSLIARTVVGGEKVVGEATSLEDNLALDEEQRTVLMASLFGGAVAVTVLSAATKVGITAAHLTEPLAPLNLDSGSIAILERGCERLIAQDFISAAHVLIPHLEDVIRQHLTSLGVDTQKFKMVEGNTSRTDDATLGRLLTQARLPDGTTVREYFGEDVWHYFNVVLASQTGLNLRHNFAHGLARPHHTTPENVGIALSLFYILSNIAVLHRTPSANGE